MANGVRIEAVPSAQQISTRKRRRRNNKWIVVYIEIAIPLRSIHSLRFLHCRIYQNKSFFQNKYSVVFFFLPLSKQFFQENCVYVFLLKFQFQTDRKKMMWPLIDFTNKKIGDTFLPEFFFLSIFFSLEFLQLFHHNRTKKLDFITSMCIIVYLWTCITHFKFQSWR